MVGGGSGVVLVIMSEKYVGECQHVSWLCCLQTETVSDIRKKWHVAPNLSVDFVGYYLGL